MRHDDERYDIQIDVGGDASRERATPRSDTPFAIALVGDFGGHRAPGALGADGGGVGTDRRPIRVDRDSLDDAIARVIPTLRISLSPDHAPIALRFSSLDDFHPDHLAQRLGHLQPLRQAREGLLNPRSSRATPTAESEGPTHSAGGGGLLDQILGEEPAPPGGVIARPPADPGGDPVRDDGFADFLRRAVDPHRLPGPDPQREVLLAEADRAIAAELRAVLHHPEFQHLESVWRGVAFLAQRLDTGESLHLTLIDLSKAELAAELSAAGSGGAVAKSILRHIVRGPAGDGAQPWGLLVGLYEFGPGGDDLALVAQLAELARAAGTPWLSAAAPGLVGASSFDVASELDGWNPSVDPEWESVRALDSSRFVGLVAPRVLLRVPYGEDTDPCDMRFEEFEPGMAPSHGEYLWGNGALAAALLLGEAFDRDGFASRPQLQVDDLPMHLAHVGGEVVATPCAEVLLADRALVRMLDRGVMPLVSARERDVVRLARFQSIASPVQTLAGRWRNG